MISIKKLALEAYSDETRPVSIPEKVQFVKQFLIALLQSNGNTTIQNLGKSRGFNVSYQLSNSKSIVITTNPEGDPKDFYVQFPLEIHNKLLKILGTEYSKDKKLWLRKEFLKYKQNPSSYKSPFNSQDMQYVFKNLKSNQSNDSDSEMNKEGQIPKKVAEMKSALEKLFKRKIFVEISGRMGDRDERPTWILRDYPPNSTGMSGKDSKYQIKNGLNDTTWVKITEDGTIVAASRMKVNTGDDIQRQYLSMKGQPDESHKQFYNDLKAYFNQS